MRIWADSVEERTAADPGVGDLELAGATDGNRPFSEVPWLDGNECDYRVETSDLSAWEIGSGTYDAGMNTLSRDTVFVNSLNTIAKVDLTGVCTVYLTLTARRVRPLLPLVTGALPGPDLVADGNGECVGVPL